MHRNTFINSPRVLEPTYQLKANNQYILRWTNDWCRRLCRISRFSGLLAGINAAKLALGEELVVFPHETALGSMARYITEADPKNFQPMNINFGLFPDLTTKVRDKKERTEQLANRALTTIQNFMENIAIIIA